MAKRPTRSDAATNPDPARVLLDGARLSLSALESLSSRPLRVEITPQVWSRVERSASAVARIAAGAAAAYGVNTGFGTLCRKRIAEPQLRTLQKNLVVSHAVGVGPAAPTQVVRWMLLFKIASLAQGYSGISRKTLQLLLDLLNHDALPVVPTQGSLGASGDLAPLAHLVLPLLGQGYVQVGDRLLPGAEGIASINAAPVELGPKEGLALINGTQFMSAYGAEIAIRGKRLMKCADVIAAMSLEGAAGSAKPFDERLHQLRPHRGAVDAAANMRLLLADSEILRSHADCDRVQDPYSLRCVPQVHGACREALEHAWGIIETEINSVTDNPLIFEQDEVLSGGLFHGEPVAMALDYLALALAELGSISERRTYLLLTGIGGLPTLLMRDTGLNNGLMLPQYTAAALVSENKGLCFPACVDSIPTSLGQEDHVSMGARAACKCLQVLENCETVLAIELLCAAQALDFRLPLRAGAGPRAAHDLVRRRVTHAEADRLYGHDIEECRRVLTADLLAAVENTLGAPLV